MMLGERVQTQKATYCMSSSMWSVWNKQTHTDSRLVVARVGAEGRLVIGTSFLFF
jgi:hypothetical protein